MTKLCPRGKAAAKRKFKVYPSAYANAYASKICAGKIKDPSGVKRKDFRGSKAEGGLMEATSRLKRQGLKNAGRPAAVKSRDPSKRPAAMQRRKRMEESTKKTNLIEKKKAKFKALQESARGEGSAKTSPMRTERAFEKFRSPRNAKTYFADRPGSKYEGMAKERLEKQIKTIRSPLFKIYDMGMAKGGRAELKGGGICKRGMNRKAVGKNS